MAKPFCRKIVNVGDINKLSGKTNDLVDFILTQDNQVYVRVKGAYKLITGGGGTPEKGDKGDPGTPGKDGTSVTVGEVTHADGKTTITFSDGSQVEIPDGVAGKDGTSVSVGEVTHADGKSTITFSDGSQVEIPDGVAGKDGKDGAPGKDGKDGAPGKDGDSGESAQTLMSTGFTFAVKVKNGIIYFYGNVPVVGVDTNQFRLASNAPLDTNADLIKEYQFDKAILPAIIDDQMTMLQVSFDETYGLLFKNLVGTITVNRQFSLNLSSLTLVVDPDKL